MAQSLLHYLIGQSKKPSGFIGRIMTRIWSVYFHSLSTWSLKQIDHQNSHTVLDVGFGGGANIKLLANQPQTKIWGIDPSNQALKQTAKRLKKKISAGKVDLRIGDVCALPFSSQSFDLITATQTHIYWENLEQGLTECCRVLKNDGKLLITSEKNMVSYHLPVYQDPADFSKLLTQIGYKRVQIKTSKTYIGFICEK